MRTLKLSLFASAMLLGSFTTAIAQSAEDVLNKHIAAVGGADNWKKVTSMKFSGTMNLQGNEVKVTRTIVQSKGMRMDMDISMGGSTINNYMIVTNTSGWQFFPVMGQTKAEAMTADDVKSSQEMLNVLDDVIRLTQSGDKTAYVGKEKVDGKECHKLTATDKDGDVTTMYFDATTGLLTKKTQVAEVQGQKAEIASTFSNYKKLPEGISVPMTMSNSAEGEITLTSVEVNKPVDESIFKPTTN